MSAVSRVRDTRWLSAASAVDTVPCFTIFLDGVPIGAERLSLTHLDANAIRTLYLGVVQTRLGPLSVMVETPPSSETQVRECDAAVRALDAVSYSFENGATATLDADTGFWAVTMGGETIATACERGDALAIAHRQQGAA